MKKITSFKERAKVFIWPGEQGAWHFMYVSKKRSANLRRMYKSISKGFGSLPVDVTIGKTTWRTSIFYDGRSQQYLLPLKASVRKKEGIAHEDVLVVRIVIHITELVTD